MNLIRTIGTIKSPYKEKFGVPRQSGLNCAEAIIELSLNQQELDRLRGLEEFSHLWVIFQFHLIEEEKANEQVLVRPPRLGGALKKGIYATRTPHRPNRIGLSVVKIKAITDNKIFIIGGDFVDGTPVLDLKPYIAEDIIPNAIFGWTENAREIAVLKIYFRENIILSTEEKNEISELLKIDPRPAHQKDEPSYHKYKVFIKDMNITFSFENAQTLWVEEITKLK